MKKYYWLLLTAVALTTIIVVSCSKIEGRTDNLPALNAQDNDLNAGNWKTVLLSRNDTFAVAAPAAATSMTP